MDLLAAALVVIVGVVVGAEVLAETRAAAQAEALGKLAEEVPGHLGRVTAEDLEGAQALEAQGLDLAGDPAAAGTAGVVAGNSSSFRMRDKLTNRE